MLHGGGGGQGAGPLSSPEGDKEAWVLVAGAPAGATHIAHVAGVGEIHESRAEGQHGCPSMGDWPRFPQRSHRMTCGEVRGVHSQLHSSVYRVNLFTREENKHRIVQANVGT